MDNVTFPLELITLVDSAERTSRHAVRCINKNKPDSSHPNRISNNNNNNSKTMFMVLSLCQLHLNLHNFGVDTVPNVFK